MGSLSLCADSARPPGMINLLKDTNGSCNTYGIHFCNEKHGNTAPSLYVDNDNPYVFTYYYSHNAVRPSSHLYLPTQSSLHVISALTRSVFTLAQQKMRNPSRTCNWPKQHWLTPSPRQNNKNTNPPMYNMHDQAQTTPSMRQAAPLWLPITFPLCFILMATLNISRQRMKRTHMRTRITQQRQQYPLTKTPGTQSNYSKTTATTWNKIYDSLLATIITSRPRMTRTRMQTRTTQQQRQYPLTKNPRTLSHYSNTATTTWNTIYGSLLAIILSSWRRKKMTRTQTRIT